MAPGRRPKAQWRDEIAAFEARIGHVFADRDLIEHALTHLSAVPTGGNRLSSYQRLEFLGDHVLGLVVSDMIYTAFPQDDEGSLSRRLAELVRAEACAEVGESLEMGRAVKLGPGESSSGGRKRKPILADVCEAVIGALFVDAGYEAARTFIIRHWHERMLNPRRPLRDAKTRLQEWAQGRGLPTPTYHEVSRKGPPHAPVFLIGVAIPGIADGEGEGASKRIAEQVAAEYVLRREGVPDDE